MKRTTPKKSRSRSVREIARDPRLTDAEKLAEVTTALRELGDDPLDALAWRLSMFQWLGRTPTFERMVHILRCNGLALFHPEIQSEIIRTMGELRASSAVIVNPASATLFFPDGRPVWPVSERVPKVGEGGEGQVTGPAPDKAPARKRMRQVVAALQHEEDVGANTARVARAAEIERWIAAHVHEETGSVRETLKAAVKKFGFKSVHALEQEQHRARELQKKHGEAMAFCGFEFPRRKGRRL